MKCKRKMQKRRDVLTVIGMMILLAFILRMWPILLLMLIGVFFYALWMLFHMDAAPQQPAQAPLMAQPPPASEESVLNTAFSVLQRRQREGQLPDPRQPAPPWGQLAAHLQGTAEERLFRRGTAGGRHPGADQSQIGSVNKNELETVCVQPAFACAF